MRQSPSPEQMVIYKRTASKRKEQDEQAMRMRRALAWAIARVAARLLKKRFGARRVIVYGSLAHGAWFHRRSDIDLAVDGIKPGKFFRAWAMLDRLDSPFEIDLTDYALAPARLRAVIDQEGIEL